MMAEVNQEEAQCGPDALLTHTENTGEQEKNEVKLYFSVV
jgi:hypothetical protein